MKENRWLQVQYIQDNDVIVRKTNTTLKFSEDIWVDALKGKLQQWLVWLWWYHGHTLLHRISIPKGTIGSTDWKYFNSLN